MNKTIISVLFLLFLTTSTCVIGDSELSVEKQQEAILNKAYRLISSFSGDSKPLDEAKAIIDKVILAAPQSAAAHTALAKYYLVRGWINGAHNYEPGTYDKVDNELKIAIATDPKYAFAYVVQAQYWYAQPTSTFSLQNAFFSYKHAMDLGYDYRKVQLNIVRIYMDGNFWTEAETALKDFESYASNTKLDAATSLSLANVQVGFYMHSHDYAKVDNAYQVKIKANPTSAWEHGNYANFLIFTLGRTDDAIREAEVALKLMDYGMAHSILGISQLCKWAELRKANPEKAKAFLEASKPNFPGINWIAVRAFSSTGNNKAMQNLSEALLEEHIPINIPDEDGDPAIAIASDAATVEWLLKHGANPNDLDHLKNSLLYYAARLNRAEIIKILSEHGVDVNQTKDGGNTVLFSAVFSGSSDAVSALLKAGARPDFGNGKLCTTPLMEAARQGNAKIVKILIDGGAKPAQVCVNPNLPNEPKTAAEYADKGGHKDVSDLLRLAAKGPKL